MFNPDPELAFKSLDEQESRQAAALDALIIQLQQSSPFYRKMLGESSDPVNDLSFLAGLPTTSKTDLAADWTSFLCVPRKDIREYFCTSGTIGRPVTIALTENDLTRLAYNERQSFRIAGCSEEDVFQLLLTLDKQFMAGMAYYSGIRALGGAVIRTGPGLPAMQWEVAVNAGTTTMVCVPSFLNKMLQWSAEHQVAHSVKRAICIGEPIRRADLSPSPLATAIGGVSEISLHSTYAATEMQTAFTECSAGQGGHQQPELIITEILDEDGKPIADGTPGEVTITTLGIEGMPLLRYRTGDICARHTSACTCGRHSPRLGPVIGRKGQAIKYKGTTLYPQAVTELMHSASFIEGWVLSADHDDHGLDAITLHLHSTLSQDACTEKLRPILQAHLRVVPPIVFHSAEEIARMQMPPGTRKVLRFIDKRPAF